VNSHSRVVFWELPIHSRLNFESKIKPENTQKSHQHLHWKKIIFDKLNV
jgi:hypothetical protein